MIARGATFVWLVGVWLVLVESATLGAVLVGAAVAAGLMATFRPPTRDIGSVDIRPLALARLVLRFLYDLVHANLLVAWAVVDPGRVRDRRAVVRLAVAEMPDTATMVLANAISLTPGTFILEITRDPTIFYIHVLQVRSVDEELRDLWLLERRVARAFGLDEARATIEGWLAAHADRDPGSVS